MIACLYSLIIFRACQIGWAREEYRQQVVCEKLAAAGHKVKCNQGAKP